MLASLYNGNVHVWNHENQTLTKSFEVTDLPGKVVCVAVSFVWFVNNETFLFTPISPSLSLSLPPTPVRAAKFVVRKSWVVTGSDDMQIRVFNYNTLEKVHTFEAHTDYIRSIIVHPTHPYILTSSGTFSHSLIQYSYSTLTHSILSQEHVHF